MLVNGANYFTHLYAEKVNELAQAAVNKYVVLPNQIALPWGDLSRSSFFGLSARDAAILRAPPAEGLLDLAVVLAEDLPSLNILGAVGGLIGANTNACGQPSQPTAEERD